MLARHGFAWLWSRWRIGTILGSLEHPGAAHSDPAETQPENFRRALEELGPTCIKLGQMLSTRLDLLPKEFVAELSKLQDDAPKVPYEQIAEVVQNELGERPERKFRSFESIPRAAGSIAQVHDAVLPDGASVVVKVRRPGIELQIDEDLAILSRIARFLASETELGKRYDLAGLLDEFAFTLRNELDFVREGQNADRIAAQFVDDPTVRVPKIFWEFSSHGVLTMENVQGIKISDLAALDAAGIDRKELARTCARFAIVQVLQKGFFHADPHPGNFFVHPGGVIAVIDYGMVGRLNERLRRSLLRIATAISHKDPERLLSELLDLGTGRGLTDRSAATRDLDRMLIEYDGLSLGSMSAGKIANDLTSIAQRNGLTLPSDLLLVARVVAMDEGMGAMLDPDFHLIEFVKPYVKEFWMESHSLFAVASRAKEVALDFADNAAELPERLLRLTGRMERGEMAVVSRIEVPDSLAKDLQRAVNRIAISVLTAGLIVGLSVLTLVYRPTGSEGFGSFLLKALLVCSLLLGVWLIVDAWKSTRNR